MRYIIAICAGVIAASLFLFVAQPFGSPRQLPAAYARQTTIVFTRNLVPGEAIDPGSDLAPGVTVSQQTHYLSHGFGHMPPNIATIPEGAQPRAWLESMQGLHAAESVSKGQNYHGQLAITSYNLQQRAAGFGHVVVFAKDAPAGSKATADMLYTMPRPRDMPLRGLRRIETHRLDEDLARYYGGRVLAIDVKAGMPVLETMFVLPPWQDPAARPRQLTEIDMGQLAAILMGQVTGQKSGKPMVLVWSRSIAPGTIIDPAQDVALRPVRVTLPADAILVTTKEELEVALANIRGRMHRHPAHKGSPIYDGNLIVPPASGGAAQAP